MVPCLVVIPFITFVLLQSQRALGVDHPIGTMGLQLQQKQKQKEHSLSAQVLKELKELGEGTLALSPC